MSEVCDKITEYLFHGGLYNPELMQHEKVRDLLIESRAEIAWLKETNSQWITDSAETDTVVRDEARKVLAPMDVDGDSYAVPSIEDIVESLVSEIARLREAIRRLADQDATLSICNGSVTVTMDGTLTPEEREAVEAAKELWIEESQADHVAVTLSNLLDRLGGER